MKKNVGSIDKIIRILIAVLAAYFGYNGGFESPINYILYAVAAIMLLTTLMGSCPIYSVLGLKTNKKA